ncbi:MAG: DUF1566 domain-containing protein [Prevotellaceae bacterium]|jgi:uncharacterized protein (TIGR02145 family)|nr:DUF1566 domain-containing protein [Prevotellaceae bacterium]
MKKIKYITFWTLLILSIFSSFGKNENSKPAYYHNEGVMINGVKWATCNIDRPGTFAAKPEDAGMFYQWNRKIGWSTTEPTVNSNGSSVWSSSIPAGDTWEKANDPSPAGWRVPTLDEIKTLLNTDKVHNEPVIRNGVGGIKFTCKASGNSIFLPVAGYRGFSSGTISNVKTGCYWTSTPYGSYDAYSFYFGDGNASRLNGYRSGGRLLRCVAE